MITNIEIENFKSWKKTGPIALAPLTAIFGKNSSGKTSLIQSLLMLKQTVESPDRKTVLNTGDSLSLVDLGTYYDLVHNHDSQLSLRMSISWDIPKQLIIKDPRRRGKELFNINHLNFSTRVRQESERPVVESLEYRFDECRFSMNRAAAQKDASRNRYTFSAKGFIPKRTEGRPWPLPSPIKCYGFPDETTAYYQNTGFLSQLVLEFEQLFRRLSYLGPLRVYPERNYLWGGENPVDVGRKGELAVRALLASRSNKIPWGRGHKSLTVEQSIAYWLKELGVIHSFEIKSVSPNRKDYEVKIKISENSPQVSITDVGFGVSQLLPVLALCFYVPRGTTIILEQPEIHLHPSVQSGLADIFIEVVKKRSIQIILESHSEHLLRRLQRRIAENAFSSKDIALYFCDYQASSSSLNRLEVDLFGNITNWPPGFFGDDLGDLVAMMSASLKKQKQPENK